MDARQQNDAARPAAHLMKVQVRYGEVHIRRSALRRGCAGRDCHVAEARAGRAQCGAEGVGRRSAAPPRRGLWGCYSCQPATRRQRCVLVSRTIKHI